MTRTLVAVPGSPDTWFDNVIMRRALHGGSEIAGGVRSVPCGVGAAAAGGVLLVPLLP